jgi:hydrogenase nickel incorporation protein HypB
VVLINKIDLLPYVNFDMEHFVRGVEILNPGVTTFPVSNTTGEGMDAWASWLVDQVRTFRH